MAAGFLSMAHPAITLSGIAGNVVSFLVFLAPLTTFVQVVRKKTTGGFSAVPYVVALFSSTLWILYALLKGNSRPLLTINGFGCGVELVYVVAYLLYAPRRARLRALAYFLSLDVAAFAVVAAVALLGVAPEHRVKFLGSVCLAFSMAVFVAPLSIIFKVIKTKSVEFMPISLSFCLVLSAVAWFCYGYFTKDPYVMYPNVGGLFFSCVQMGLYFYYRRPSNAAVLPTTADGATGGAAVQAQVIELPPHAVAILSVSNIPILGMHKIEVMAAPAPPPEQQDIEKPAPAPEAVETGAATTAAV